MGHCVWWLLEYFWCKRCMQTAWVRTNRYIGTYCMHTMVRQNCDWLAVVTDDVVRPPINCKKFCLRSLSLREFFSHRCNCPPSCLLWSGNWNHSSGPAEVYWEWDETCELSQQPTWHSWLFPLWRCWSHLSRYVCMPVFLDLSTLNTITVYPFKLWLPV